jgi:hypothetical protein
VRVCSFGSNIALDTIGADLRSCRNTACIARAVYAGADAVVCWAYAALLAEALACLEARLLAPSFLCFAGLGVYSRVKLGCAGGVAVVCVCRGRGLLRGGSFGIAGTEIAVILEGFRRERVRGYCTSAFVDGIAGAFCVCGDLR